MRRASWVLLCLVPVTSACARRAPREDVLPVAIPNDNRAPAGVGSDSVREVSLVARAARWMPEGDGSGALAVEAFAEEGQAPSIPAPLLRVREGGRIRLGVRNALGDTLLVCGLAGRYCAGRDTLRLAPGGGTTLDVRADAPGTYFYWGTTVRAGRAHPRGTGGQLVGAYIVDARDAGPVHDRVFVMTAWSGTRPAAIGSDTPFVMGINGRTWPRTERLAYQIGDTARWRVISAAGEADHPMHLHGFYFRVDARGGAARDTLYAADQRRSVVTENLPSMSSMSLTWVPTREGHWIFHCHRAAHMSGEQHLHLIGRPNPRLHDLASMPNASHAMSAMAGLIMGITVSRGPRVPSAAIPALQLTAERPLRLVVQRRAARYGREPGFGYVLQDGATPPRADSIRIPGSPIVLRRGEPVAITVVNRPDRATAVHWHGIELESYFDGVPGWSGSADGAAATTPMIAPGDSFVVRFTPPRSGTFIYHSHSNEQFQLSSGLYGALLVLDDPARWDPTTDHVLIMGQDGPSDTGPVVLNGGAPPAPLELRAGRPHRLRFINIIPQDMADVELRADSTRLRWTAVAKDGAELPPSQRISRDARVLIGPGETYDFELTPKPGLSQLVIRSFNKFTTTIRAR